MSELMAELNRWPANSLKKEYLSKKVWIESQKRNKEGKRKRSRRKTMRKGILRGKHRLMTKKKGESDKDKGEEKREKDRDIGNKGKWDKDRDTEVKQSKSQR